MTSILAACLLAQSIWYVDASALPPGNGTIVEPYTRIDYAVDQAATLSGDRLLVNAGVYLDERIDFSGRTLQIEGVPGSAGTVVVGDGQSSIVTIEDAAGDSAISGVTFRGGRGNIDPSSGLRRGGAVFTSESALELTNCAFFMCEADVGGAIFAENHVITSKLEMGQCRVDSTCTASTTGGGIAAFGVDMVATGCSLEGSVFGPAGGSGGAVYMDVTGVYTSLVARDCVIRGSAPGDGGALFVRGGQCDLEDSDLSGQASFGGRGGGAYLSGSSATQWIRTRAHDCRAASGGAVFAADVNATRFSFCVFTDNETTPWGSGSARGGAIYHSGFLFVDRSVFGHNRAMSDPGAEGGATWGILIADNCTFADNDASSGGGTAFLPSLGSQGPNMVRSIVVPADGTSVPAINDQALVRISLVQGGFQGPFQSNVLDADPLFWAPTDFHLLPDSPVIYANGNWGGIPFDPFWCGVGCTGDIGLVSCVAQPNSTGLPSEISALGSLDVSQDRVVLNVTGVQGQVAAFYFAGTAANFVPGAGGSAGTLCLGGQIERFPVLAQDPFDFALTYRPRLTGFPSGHVVQPGETWFFQLWHRDSVQGQATSNFSPAIYLAF